MKVRVAGGPLTVDLSLSPIEERRSPYQHLLVAEAEEFGRLLVLDGEIQFSELDEHVYHEMLAYPPYLFSPKREKRVLILGGGDGLLASRLLNLGLDVTIVDLDKEVVELSKKYFYDMGAWALDKAHVVIGDALTYTTDKKFDVVYIDLTDFADVPQLYSQSAFNHYKLFLTEGGILATHVDYYKYEELLNRVSSLFSHHLSYAAYVPSFTSLWTFIVMKDGKEAFDVSLITNMNLKGKYFSPQAFWLYDPPQVPSINTEEKSFIVRE